MFDLPTTMPEDLREYTRFRKYLVKSGFLMMQESIYCKLALNTTVSDAIIRNIKNNKPRKGLVQILTLTEKQFSKMELIVGDYSKETLDSDERLVIL